MDNFHFALKEEASKHQDLLSSIYKQVSTASVDNSLCLFVTLLIAFTQIKGRVMHLLIKHYLIRLVSLYIGYSLC